ncbi:hypothetical protein F25303_10614 [Fusarium sp. NRRL 25303]|nr:hypothetical protein F25303_10614 [Fusarium sp. NRRL 25303]
MANHAGPQNIDNPLYTLNIEPVPLPILDERDDKPNVVYSWADDDKEEFELKPVDNISDPITVHKRSHYQEPPFVAGKYMRVPFLQKHPGHPLAVVFQAMKAANPDWRCDHVDFIAQSDLLSRIYSWISGDHTSSFVIDASQVNNTLCITLFKDEKPSSDSQEDESPSPSPTTIGQHQILEYSFGGLNLLVTSPGHLIHLTYRQAGVRFARIFPTNNRPPARRNNVLSLLWFGGTHTYVSGSVSDGVFKQDNSWYVPERVHKWGRRNKTRRHMQTMVWLLSYVRIINSWEMFSGSCSIHFEVSGDHKRLKFYAARRAQKLPTLFGEFWDYT